MDLTNTSLSSIINYGFTESSYDQKNKIYCSNCGKYGHIYKKCKDPITSIGIINICLNDTSLTNFFKNKYIIENIAEKYRQNNYYLKNINVLKFNEKNRQNSQSNDISKYIDLIKPKIKFLLIRRKNTVGYIEFVRGRYNNLDDKSILFLLNQMTHEEINFLKNNNFEHIWSELWDNKYADLPYDENSIKNLDTINETLFQINLDKLSSKDKYIYTKVHIKEFALSKSKFEYIMENKIIDLLDDQINILFEQPEWGFPKGRRNLHEKNLDCAIREFAEETGINLDHISVLDRIYPLNEILRGTNNLNYKHSYYLSLGNMENVNLNLPSQKIEIGAIGWFTYDEAIQMIRPYHINRLKVLDEVIKFLAYNIRYYMSFKKTIEL